MAAPPVLFSFAPASSKCQNRTSCPFFSPHPTQHSFPPSLSLSLPSPMGRADISSSTKELVAGMEKQQRQLHSHGTKDRVACVHLQHRLPLSPARSLSNSLVSLIHIPAPFYHSVFLSPCLPLWSHSNPRSEPPQWITSEFTHRGQPKPAVQTRDDIRMIGRAALDRGNEPSVSA